MNAFTSDGISGLEDLDDQGELRSDPFDLNSQWFSFSAAGWVDSDKANVFVADHDTERDSTSLNYNSANNAYTLAMIFSLCERCLKDFKD